MGIGLRDLHTAKELMCSLLYARVIDREISIQMAFDDPQAKYLWTFVCKPGQHLALTFPTCSKT